MNTQAALERAVELVDEGSFDIATYEACAATALYRALADTQPGAERGEVDEPAGEYAALLDYVCTVNAFPQRADLLSALHDGLWAIMRQDGRTARDAARVTFRTALGVARTREPALI